MVLKAVFLEFSGVVIKDTDLQKRLVDEILIAENLRPDPVEFAQTCFGRSDRACLDQLLTRRGRVAPPKYLGKLLEQKSEAYIQVLSQKNRLPLYPGLQDFLYQLKTASLPIGLVTGAGKKDVEWVLARAGLMAQFTVKVTGEDTAVGEAKPATKPYEIAIAQLNQQFPELALKPENCLAVEASFVGINAAQRASIPVVGVAHLYPYQMIQRRATWVVDYLNEIELDWIQQGYGERSAAIEGTLQA
ncbi:MAG: HAD hydrolase-like protein [Cyanobacteria bacterium J06626_18]